MKTIDLRSDTVTVPSEKMRKAMYEAALGDDVYGEDPTVNRLQEKTADLFGKEAGLFVTSGTMGNFVALLTHCQRGDQAIVGELSHIAQWEQRGAEALGGIPLKTLPNIYDGTIDIKLFDDAIPPDDVHCQRTKLICLENTWHGRPLTVEYMKEVRDVADKHKLQVHLDGARIFNASVALGVSLRDLAKHVDTVQLCFSKGLACPVGSMLCGSKEFIKEARRMRKVLGGGMRQAGVLAAACEVALQTMIERMAEDHETAQILATGLAGVDGVRDVTVATNMVFLKYEHGSATQADFVRAMKSSGVLLGREGSLGIRAVTHYGISADDISEVVERANRALVKA